MDKLLNEIYEKDIQDRLQCQQGLITLSKVDEADRERRAQTQKLIDDGKLKTGLDFHRASLIFQHGDTPEDFKKAHELAQKAIDLGDETAKELFAKTLDRWLLSEGKSQKYGTQFTKNKRGEWELVQPIDPITTDEERSLYNLPPLGKAIDVFKARRGV